MKKNKFIKTWAIPLFVSLLMFFLVRPTFAEIIAGKEQLSLYLQNNDVSVGVETKNGYQQVYFLKSDGGKEFITEGGRNSRMPYSKGEYVVYVTDINGAGQIFRTNITTDTTIQITNSSTNLNPKVDREGRVVWERWLNNSWQIFMFDGILIKQVSNEGVSINATLENDYLVYSQKDDLGIWRAIGHRIRDSEEVIVDVGSEVKFPVIKSGELIFLRPGSKSTKNILKLDDLFILESYTRPVSDPPNLNTPEKFTEDDIVNTINDQTDIDISENLN